MQQSCLLDTGSSINVLSKTAYDSLHDSPRLMPTATVAKTASQSSFPLLGRVVLQVEVAKESFSVPFFVTDVIDVPVLLGLEFLRVCPCVVDLKNQCLVLAPAECVTSRSIEVVAVGSAVNSKDVVVPPGTEMFLQCRAPRCSYKGPVLLEPVWSKEGLLFLPAVVDVDGDSVPVVVRNISAEHITVPGRTEIAQLEVGFAEEATTPCDDLTLTELGCDTEQSLRGFKLEDEVQLTGAQLSDPERQKFLALLQKYSSMFDGRLGHTDLVTHKIDTRSSSPVRQAPRRIPPHLRAEVKAEIDRMVKQGVIEETNGCWGSPICLVRRRNGKLRLCADFRALNAKTHLPSYSIPRVDDTLEALAGSSLYIVLDFNSAYYQISVDPADQEKTTIVTPFGTYKHLRMPFGAKGACCTCARLLDIVLRGLSPHVALSYFDDVILHGNSVDELLSKLETVLDRLKEAGLTLNLSKCQWFQPSVTFLGHVVSKDGLRADPVKLEKVRQWPTPRSVKELMSFLGLATYFRRYLRNFSALAGPLFRLTNKDLKQFDWTCEAQAAFDALKDALCDAPVLSLPRFDAEAGEFVLEVDASGTGIGAVLLQRQGEEEKLIAYGSRQLSKSETNYGVCKRELLSAVYFIRHFHPYLVGKPFLLRSDHASLQWLISFKNPTGMLARWIETLSQYSFRIEHKPGALNSAADALSRMPAATADAATQTDCADPVRLLRSQDWSTSFLRSEQDSDSSIADITNHLSRGVKPHKRQLGDGLPFLAQWSKLRLLDGVLFRVYRRRPHDEDQLQVVVPSSLVHGVLVSMHGGPTGGHFAADKLLAQVRLRFWWPKMVSDITQFCARCERCNSRIPPVPAPRASLGQLAASEPFEVVGLDILSGLPRTANGNKHLLVVVDHFSRWCEVFPLKDMSASGVATVFVNEFVSRFGVPSRIHSDQGGCFMGELLTKTCELLGVEKSAITSYHPQGNGVVERMNRTILSMLAKYLDENAHSEWDQHLPMLMLGYRSQIHKSLRFSPYEVLFGRRARLPTDVALDPQISSESRPIAEYLDRLKESLKAIHHDALSASQKSHARNKAFYEKKMNEFSFVKGQTVRLHKAAVPKGQYYKFTRPYKRAKIISQVGPLNYRVKVEGRDRPILVHHNRLSPCETDSKPAEVVSGRVLGRPTDSNARGVRSSHSKGDSGQASDVSSSPSASVSAPEPIILNPMIPLFRSDLTVQPSIEPVSRGPGGNPVGPGAGPMGPESVVVSLEGSPVVPGLPEGANGEPPGLPLPPPPPDPPPVPALRRSARVRRPPDRY